jgi:hypothetical protein
LQQEQQTCDNANGVFLHQKCNKWSLVAPLFVTRANLATEKYVASISLRLKVRFHHHIYLHNKLTDKLSHKVASVSLWQTNLVCYKLLTEEHDKNVRHLLVSRFYDA